MLGEGLHACMTANIESIRLLLNYKCIRVNARDNCFKTPLQYAHRAGNQECIDLMIKHGAKAYY